MRPSLPFVLLWALLLALWLTLNATLDAAHVVLGGAIALGATLTLRLLDPPRVRLRKPLALVSLAWVVAVDIIRSNVAVMRIVLGARAVRRTSDFLDIPLELRDPAGLVVLACIITSTPGTVWAAYDAERGVLTLHILDLVDDEAWIRTIKERYERRLLEIFQ